MHDDLGKLEDFCFSLREAILKAEGVGKVPLPEVPAVAPLKTAIALLAALAPLERNLLKAVDIAGEHLTRPTPEEVESFFHQGQVIT